MVERQEARAAKDFARADEIRDELAALGWEVRDSADGSAARAEVLMASQFIYGVQPVQEAERGRRRVHKVWRAPETLGGGAGAALWIAGPPGGRRRGRSLSVRRRGGDAAAGRTR